MNFLKVFATTRDAQHDYQEFVHRNNTPAPRLSTGRLATFEINAHDHIVWIALGDHGHDLHRSLDNLRGLSDLMLLHVDRYVTNVQMDHLLPFVGRVVFRRDTTPQAKRCLRCGDPGGHGGLSCPHGRPMSSAEVKP